MLEMEKNIIVQKSVVQAAPVPDRFEMAVIAACLASDTTARDGVAAVDRDGGHAHIIGVGIKSKR
jgi:hypothetical protein